MKDKEIIEKITVYHLQQLFKTDITPAQERNEIVKEIIKLKNQQKQEQVEGAIDEIDNAQKDFANLDIIDKEEAIRIIKHWLSTTQNTENGRVKK